MLNEEETIQFLTLVRAFVESAGLSARGFGAVVGISAATAARWVRTDRELQNRPYRHVAVRVRKIIENLNAANESHGVYAQLDSPHAGTRADVLRRVHTGDVVC